MPTFPTPGPLAEQYPALSAVPGFVHGFTLRVPGLDVRVDRDAALALLDESHAATRAQLGLASRRFVTARQVHGAEVAVVDANSPAEPEVDGLVTADFDVCLGIYAADCCVIYLVDPVRRAIGLLHSGRRGSEQGIATEAVRRMGESFGTQPSDLVVQLSPCIRPPDYEVDFAALIIGQCRAAGVVQVHDCGISTARDVDRYYSYRMELGRTGRMLGLLALA